MGATDRAGLVQVQASPHHGKSRGRKNRRDGDELLSYLFTAFLNAGAPPSAIDARNYLLEGALFDDRPEIEICEETGALQKMVLKYDSSRRPMALRRVIGPDSEAAREEAIELATLNRFFSIADEVARSGVILEWEVDRTELDEDAWFALHLWQAWVLERAGGWLYAPGDGLFDAQLRRKCAFGPSRLREEDR